MDNNNGCYDCEWFDNNKCGFENKEVLECLPRGDCKEFRFKQSKLLKEKGK